MLIKQMSGGFFLDERSKRRVNGEEPVANLLPRFVAPPLTERNGKASFRRAQHLWRQIQRDKVAQYSLALFAVYLPAARELCAKLDKFMVEKWRSHLEAARHAGDVELG
jgi:hypothetical protein